MENEYFNNNSDLDINMVREDFKFIWSKNITQAELIRERNPQGGDYFREDESNLVVRRKIWINLQGRSSDDYKRMDAGIITPDATLHAYVLWNEDIENLDVIKFGRWLYRITGYNKSMYAGQYAFKEFDLKRIDYELPAFNDPETGGRC